MQIRPYQASDEQAVIEIWNACDLVRPWNDPRRDIARKLSEQPELFLIAVDHQNVIGTAMVGFDGHRGWVYYLAVAPSQQRHSVGRTLMAEAERLLMERGCPKICLLVRSSNAGVIGFYEQLGYEQNEVVTLGKRLIADN